MGVFMLHPQTDEKETDLGRQSVSRTRFRRSSISWVGPPPPSPNPNRTALWLARPLSLLFFTVLISCIDSKEVEMSRPFTRGSSQVKRHMMKNLRLPLYPSSHRSFLEENEWVPVSHQYLPKRTCYAGGKRNHVILNITNEGFHMYRRRRHIPEMC